MAIQPKEQAGAVHAEAAPAGAPGRFRLMRYFTLATLGVFVAVGLALFYLQHQEEVFFERVQREQQDFFARAQTELAQRNEATARASLLAVHESAHVNLTRLVANLLWTSDFAPFVARAQQRDVAPCRAMDKGDAAAALARRACLQQLGRDIMALPGFTALDAKAYAAMRATTVIKIKVWDLRGLTVYSSEHAQIGDDGAANRGWISAAAGLPASELTHRDRFSAFEGIVENRDLISTYVPVRDDRSGAVVGVFELYSDVTPFLQQIKAASKGFADISLANQARIEATSRSNQASVNQSSDRFLLIVGGLLLLLYAASLVIVRIGQRIIDRQTREQEQAALREQRWHREKMAALSAMAANVSHEVGNPLAVIAGLAQQMPAAGGDGAPPAKTILEQTARIAQMMRQISDFSAAGSGAPELVDVNARVKAVCDFHGFDRRFRATQIDFRPAKGLPACELVPDQLNEVMMGLLQVCAEGGSGGAPARIVVSTDLRGDSVAIGLRCDAGAAEPAPLDDDARIAPLRRRVQSMGGRFLLADSAVEIVLPAQGGR